MCWSIWLTYQNWCRLVSFGGYIVIHTPLTGPHLLLELSVISVVSIPFPFCHHLSPSCCVLRSRLNLRLASTLVSFRGLCLHHEHLNFTCQPPSTSRNVPLLFANATNSGFILCCSCQNRKKPILALHIPSLLPRSPSWLPSSPVRRLQQ